MRKHDFLRRVYNQAKKEGNDSVIYMTYLPGWFRRKGDDGEPSCIPCCNLDNGMEGIAVEHPWYDKEADQWFSWSEFFWLEKIRKEA